MNTEGKETSLWILATMFYQADYPAASRLGSGRTNQVENFDDVVAALERHKDDPVPRLQFNVPLDRLINPTYVSCLTADLERMAEEGWETRNAAASTWRMIPDRTGLYMFVWRPTFRLPLAVSGYGEFPWILYIEKLLERCGGLQGRLEKAGSASDVRAPKGQEGQGHAFMRPVVQRGLVRAVRSIIDDGRLSWTDALDRISKLDWRLASPPWTAIFNTESKKMITAKENTQLLEDLLIAHLSPVSKAEILRARRDYKEIRGRIYPVEQQVLEAAIVNKEL